MPRRVLIVLVLFAAIGLRPCAPSWAADDVPAATTLGGAPASVVLPAGWTTREEAPASGQWRLVLVAPSGHAGRVLAEARVFPVEDDDPPAQVLMKAAGLVAKQVGAFGFGTPRLESRVLLGRALADADLELRAGATRLAGRLCVLRAGPALWAMAWSLCSEDAPEALREAARGFAGSLEPTEPAFVEPYGAGPDPERVLAQAQGEEPVRRRHVEATVACLEAALGLSLPRLWREEAHAALAEDVARGGPKARAGYRDVARRLHDAQGLPAAERAALAQQAGARVLQELRARAAEAYPPAARITMMLATLPSVPPGPAGLPLLHAEHLLESASLVAALAAEGWPEVVGPERRALRERASARWATLDAAAQAAWLEAVAASPTLAARWREAPRSAQQALRAQAARLVRPAASAQPEPDARALRGLLDVEPVAPAAALAAVLEAEPAVLAALLRVLPGAAPAAQAGPR